MSKVSQYIIVPKEKEFKPAKILYGNVFGKGVEDYNYKKSGGKRGGYEYVVTLQINKNVKEDYLNSVLEFWEENKPKKAGDKPKNWDGLVRDDVKEDGKFVIFTKSKTKIEDNEIHIPIYNGQGKKIDPKVFGLMGNGSKGRVSVKLSIYGDDDDAGVSVHLIAVKLLKYVEGGVTNPFSVGEDDEIDENLYTAGKDNGDDFFGDDDNKDEKPKKVKKKKKKNKSKED